MAGPVYPDVPKTDGVPAVKRSPENLGVDTQPQMSSDTITVTAYGSNDWGIYKAGSKDLALEADSISSVGYEAEHRLADYPIEEGGFESYNKVALPFNVRVVLTKGGTREDRRAFCSKIEDLRGDTELYSVVTPEKVYLNANIVRVSIDRSAEAGAGLIRAELVLQEVRQNATSSFSNTRAAASASAVNNGSTQPKTAKTGTDVVK